MLNKILKQVNKPYQYIGGELNTEKCSLNSDTTMAFAFPDVYEIGASNFGLKVLYELVNREEGLFADRVYAPGVDFLEHLEKNNLPLFSQSAKKPLFEFDFVGFSLQYELFYPTVLKMLELGKIAIKNKDRDENAPIIAAGGPCAYNPAPMSKFIDLFFIGDGDELNIKVMKRFAQLKKQGLSRSEILKKLSEIEGIYSPEFSKKVVMKQVCNLSFQKAPSKPIVPFSNCVHDRAVVELRRGCGRMCRFCQAGHTNLPIRERSKEDVLEIADLILQNSGYDEISLLSLSSNDYSDIENLLEVLSKKLSDQNVSISLPSQRIDKFSVKIAKEINKVRKATITLAPEAGSQRMRDVINKNLTKDQILSTILTCYQNGFDSFKLYFMLGLPTETKEDIKEMANLLFEIVDAANEIKKEKNIAKFLTLTVSLSIFVPKPFTPFQFAPQESLESVDEKIKYLKDLTKKLKGVKINYHSMKVSLLEAVLARADKSLCDLVEKMYKNGQYLISWEENLDFGLIDSLSNNKLRELGMKKFDLDEKLPWDVVSCGIEKSWFVEQFENAMKNKKIVPCELNCANCGVCKNLETKKILASHSPLRIENENKKDEKESPMKYVRVEYQKIGDLQYISHLDIQNTLMKLLKRTGLKLEYTKGFNPTIKISFSPALGLFMESESEYFDFECVFEGKAEDLKKILQDKSFDSLIIKNVKISDNKLETLDKSIFGAKYKVEVCEKFQSLLSKKEVLMYIKNKICSEDFYVEKKNKKGFLKQIKAKDSLLEAYIENESLIIILKAGNFENVSPLRVDLLINTANDKGFDLKIKRIEFLDKNLKKV